MLKSALSLLLLSCLLGRLDCTDDEVKTIELSVMHGEDVTLECYDHRDATVKLLRWKKPDLHSEYYVFYFRDNRFYPNYQHESFKERVILKDPGMKNGDFSVTVKNVAIGDAGIYECCAGYGNQDDVKILNSINLKVEKPDNKQETVKHGEDDTLQCYGTRHAAVIMLKWRKSDLQSELGNTNKQLYVLFIRENRTYENFQLPSFKGRVQLRDPQMKDGDLSVIIKNVSMNDAGIYECYAGYGRQDPQLMSSTNLTVEEPGPTGGQSGDGGKEDGGEKSDSVALIVGLSVPAVLFIGLVGFLIYKKCLNQSNPDYQPPPHQGIELPEVSP